MNKYLIILTLLLFPFLVKAQLSVPDSLRNELESATSDSAMYRLNWLLSGYYEERKLDSAIFFGNQALLIARKNKKELNIASALLRKGYPLRNNGKYGEALECIIEALTILEDPASEKHAWKIWNSNASLTILEFRLIMLASTHHLYALLEADMGNIDQELFHYREEIRIAEKTNASFRLMVAYMNLGNTYKRLEKPDSALYFGFRADSMAKKSGQVYYNGWNLGNIGDIYFGRKDYSLAKKYYYEAFGISKEEGNEGSLRTSTGRLFRFYREQKNVDSSLYFAKLALNSTISREPIYLTGAYENLYEAYSLKGQSDSAQKYLMLAFETRDSAYEQEISNLTDFQHLTMNEQLRLRKLEKEKVEYQGKIRTYTLLAGLGVFILVGLILYRNNRQKQKANKVLTTTIDHLKSTQSQLIQSEKMASLGELTAGIAHEIQNPLNFVNNFAEVSMEMMGELKEELKKGEIKEVKEISDEVLQNLDKINHHGKRAESIVKSMLLHSRSTGGEKVPTDINALCDEFLRLSYHGLRAKDRSFNAEFEMDFDESIPEIDVVPQDIGRVLLNLFNNAFQACSENRESRNESRENPKVIVKTKRLTSPLGVGGSAEAIQISVSDNGPGIPNSIRDKIFQPFFTTKPTGQGTGLGLSLAYDIIKAHGGEISANSDPDIGSTFTITLLK